MKFTYSIIKSTNLPKPYNDIEISFANGNIIILKQNTDEVIFNISEAKKIIKTIENIPYKE